MARAVKTKVTRSKISSKHQITIAKTPFDEAGFKAGDVVAVRALGRGRLEVTSLDMLLAKHRGRLKTGGGLRKLVEATRDEWD
jgi:uncharacterized Fe-S cluster-containing radical SAM superfamily enzyme